jgi:hypothetical protein
MTTAGHYFAADWLGRLTCGCGTRWTSIAGTTREQVGQPGIAHIGTLTATECAEIEAARDAQWLRGLGRAVELVGGEG